MKKRYVYLGDTTVFGVCYKSGNGSKKLYYNLNYDESVGAKVILLRRSDKKGKK